MKSAKDILRSLLAKQVKVLLDDTGTKVRVTGNTAALSMDDKQAIVEHKDQLVALLKKSAVQHTAVSKGIAAIPESADYAISAAQRRMWLLSQIEEESIAYNMPFTMELRDVRHIADLKRAIMATIDRHEILRTVFCVNDEGDIRQKVRSVAGAGFEVAYRDYRDQKDGEVLARTYIASDAREAFDLEIGPLIRVTLFQFTNDRVLLYVNMHHIVGDGWSLDLLWREMMAFYTAFSQGVEPKLPHLSIQFKDYAAWHNELLASQRFDQHKAYWLDRLSGDLPLLDLPGQKSRPAVKSYNGRRLETVLPEELTAALKDFGRRHEGSLFAGLLSLWYTLVYRYTDQSDMVIGTSVAGRNHVDLENQIGFYINTLALRVQMQGSERFIDLYSRVKALVAADYAHQMYPFDQLVEDLHPRRDTSRHAVFDVMVSLHNLDGRQTSGVPLEPLKPGHILDRGNFLSRMDMEVAFEERGKNLHFRIVYNTDVYELAFMEGLMRHFNQLVAAAMNHPEEKVGKLPFVVGEELQQLLPEITVDAPLNLKGKSIPDLFEALAETRPHQVALHCGGRQWTFSELDAISAQLANYLVEKKGVEKGHLVGIYLDRSEWFIVAVLAVLKAGAAFVSMDPALPQARVAYMCDDSGCRPLIDDELVTAFQAASAQHKTQRQKVEIAPGDLAYVIYTSGTSGRPKGVMITHGNLLAFSQNFTEPFGFDQLKSIAGTTTFSFDISMLEILASLVGGLQLHLMRSSELSDPDKTLEILNQQQVEVLQITPSRLAQFTELGAEFPRSLKLLLVGGEAMSTAQYERLKKAPFRVLNVYGPTETTIWSSALELAPSQRLSIGRALYGEQLYVMNEYCELQPTGIPGELCIGGAGVGMGYWNLPELSAEKFKANPHQPSGSIYRTGDIAVRQPDGTIEFMGRKDSQVKLRGYRIELGEVENNLLTHPQVDQAAVFVKDQELVALLCSKSELNSVGMRSHLKRTLPEYMVPAQFIRVDTLPLNASGKLDRMRLPGLAGESLGDRVEYVEPRTTEERVLADVWNQVLNQQNVGAKHCFYALGGNSMKTVKVVSLLKRRGYDLKVEQLLKTSILEDLAPLLHKLGEGRRFVSNDVEKHLGWAVFYRYHHLHEQAENLIVIHEGTGEFQGYRHLCESLKRAYNIWVFVLDSKSLAPVDITPQHIAKAYASVVNETFSSAQTIHLLGWSYGGYIAYLMTNDFERSGRTVRQLTMIDTPDYVDFEYGGGPKEEFFTDDFQLSIDREKALVKAICPAIDLSSIPSHVSIEELWREVEQQITPEIEFSIPPFWKNVMDKRYGDLDLATSFEIINRMRSIGLHIPTPHKEPILQTPVTYVKARASDSKHMNYWQRLTKAPCETIETDGDHGTMMRPGNIAKVANHLVEEKEAFHG